VKSLYPKPHQKFRVWFWNRARLVKVEVHAESETSARRFASESFMERYGFWPGEPHQVDRIR
jgi:hypothetical protein